MIYILGAGGHAAVVKDAIGPLEETCYVEAYDEYAIKPDGLIAIGIGDIAKRVNAFGRYDPVRIPAITHDRAIIAVGAQIFAGTQIMAGAIVQPDSVIGANTIINTGAQIDHDCHIGAHCHVAPGAILCGGAMLGERCFIGAGAVIIQGVVLDDETSIPAQSLVAGPSDIRRPQRHVRGHRGAGASERTKEAFGTVSDDT